MSHVGRICRCLVSGVGLLVAAGGPAAAVECLDGSFELKIRNKSPEPIEDLQIPALEQFGIKQLRLSPRATVELCLEKRPATCRTNVQVMYRDFPPITYERDICKERTLVLVKE